MRFVLIVVLWTVYIILNAYASTVNTVKSVVAAIDGASVGACVFYVADWIASVLNKQDKIH